VPKVIYDSISAAESALTKVGLKYSLNSSKGTGVIYSQTPAGGSSAKCGSNVDIASAPNPVSVPNVVGKSVSAAESALQAAGLKYTLNSSKGDGPINSQTPAAGKSATSGSNVDIDASATGTTTTNACTSAGGGCMTPATATADQKTGDTVKHLGGSDDTSCASYPTDLCYQVTSTGTGNACASAGGQCIAPATATADQKSGDTVKHLGGSDDTSCASYPTDLCYTVAKTIATNACTAAGGTCEKPATATTDQKGGATVKHLGGSDDTSCASYPTDLCYTDTSASSVDSSSHAISSSSTGSGSVFSEALQQTASAITNVWNTITNPIVHVLTSF